MILSVYNLLMQYFTEQKYRYYMHSLYQRVNNLDSLSFFVVQLLEQMCAVTELFSRSVPERYLCLSEFRGGSVFSFLIQPRY